MIEGLSRDGAYMHWLINFLCNPLRYSINLLNFQHNDPYYIYINPTLKQSQNKENILCEYAEIAPDIKTDNMLPKENLSLGSIVKKITYLLSIIILVTLTLSRPVTAEHPPHTDEDEQPASLAGTFLAAQFANSMKRYNDAAAFYRNALSIDPDNLDLVELNFILNLANGSIEEAFKAAHTLLENGRDTDIVRLALGIEAIKARHYENAIQHLSKHSEGILWVLLNNVLIAWAEQGVDRTNAALARLQSIKGPNWYNLFKSYNAGLINEIAGHRTKALNLLATAYKSEPESVRIAESYAAALAKSNKKDKAREILTNFLKSHPKHPMIKADLTSLDEGKAIYQPVRSIQAGASELLFGLGSAVNKDADSELASILLHFSIFLDPKAELPRLILGTLYERMKVYDEAIEIYDAIPEQSPMKPQAEIYASLNLNFLDRVDEAIKRLQATMMQYPKNLDVILALGNIMRYHKRFDEAAKIYSRGIETIQTFSSQDWNILYFRGICYERTKRWNLAEKDFLKALELQPQQADILNYLGYSWVDQGLHLEKALKMIQKAVQLEPRSGFIIDSLGWVYYRLGRYEDAVQELERAVTLVPGDPVINDHLGDAYWHVGRKLEAKFQWKHAHDLNPEPDELKKIQEKLKNGLAEVTINNTKIDLENTSLNKKKLP